MAEKEKKIAELAGERDFFKANSSNNIIRDKLDDKESNNSTKEESCPMDESLIIYRYQHEEILN